MTSSTGHPKMQTAMTTRIHQASLLFQVMNCANHFIIKLRRSGGCVERWVYTANFSIITQKLHHTGENSRRIDPSGIRGVRHERKNGREPPGVLSRRLERMPKIRA